MKYTLKTIFIALVCVLSGPLYAEGKLSLKDISAYLNTIKSVEGYFTQTNPDKTISKGRLLIKRPGRMRFEYAKPNPALVVAGQGQVAIFDKKSRSVPQMFPLFKTPIGIILKNNVNLNKSKMIINHTYQNGTTYIVAQDPKRPEYGSVQLAFSDNPVALRQWITKDRSGRKTTIVLGKLDKAVQLSDGLFNIEQIARDLGQLREEK